MGTPVHPGSYWQECKDVNTGYPYFWNTLNNQVVWDCPAELIQYRQALLAAPPPLPPLPPQPTPSGGGLVAGYGTDSEGEGSDGEEEMNGDENKDADEMEEDPEFIGPKIPSLPKVEENTEVEIVKPEQHENLTKAIEDINEEVHIENPELPKLPDNEDVVNDDGQPPVPGLDTNHDPVPIHQVQMLAAPPPPPMVPAGLGSLVSAYSDSDTSDQEEEDIKPAKSHFKKVKGQMDSSGKLHFASHTSWQTEEQKAALHSYHLDAEKATKAAAATKKAAATKSNAGKDKKAAVSAGGRKQRLALPGGKFNKSDSSENKPTLENKSDTSGLTFVKSNSVIPGSQPPEENGADSEEPSVEDLDARVERLMAAQANIKAASPTPSQPSVPMEEIGPSLPPHPPTPSERESSVESSKSVERRSDTDNHNDISKLSEDELAEELVEKLQHFKVNTEKISSLKLLAVKIETLYSAWCAGALNRKYLKIFLENAHRRLLLVESIELTNGPWSAKWDRFEKRYEFTNSETGVTTHINPSEASLVDSEDAPPPLPSPTKAPQPAEPDAPPPPPPPPCDDDTPPAPRPPLPYSPTPSIEEEEEIEDGEIRSSELLQPLQPRSTAQSASRSVSPSVEVTTPTMNNEPEDMDMSDDDVMNDDDGIPLTPPTPGALESSADHDSDAEDRASNGTSTPPPGLESTPLQKAATSQEAAVSQDEQLQDGEELPPPPPGYVVSAAPGLTVSRQPQVKVTAAPEKRPHNLTDELSSFYSEIGFSDLLDEPGSGADPAVDTVPGTASKHESSAEPTSGGDSAPPSPTGSPLPKKRKRKEKNVKVSTSLSMKKKGLNSMLAKWQNIK